MICINVNQNKRREQKNIINNIPLECFTLSEEFNKNRLTEIVELLCLEYLNAQEKKSINQ